MSRDRYTLLVYKKLKGELSISEAEELSSWLKENDHQQEAEKIQQAWEASLDTAPLIVEPKLDEAFAALKPQLVQQKSSLPITASPQFSWQKVFATAAMVAMVVLLVRFISDFSNEPEQKMFTTTEGQKKEIPLPNGSIAWLNENSQLIFTDDAVHNQLRFELSGEALFKFNKEIQQPIFVKDHYCLMETLGTVFNVRSYPGQFSSEVAVEEGEVKVSAIEDPEKVVSVVGAEQRFVYQAKSGQSNIIDDTNLNCMAWQRNYLQFNDTPIVDVLRDLEHYLGVKLKALPSKMEACKFKGRYKLNESSISTLQHFAEAFALEINDLGASNYAFSGGTPCVNKTSPQNPGYSGGTHIAE